jgi:copper chaperone CopZ
MIERSKQILVKSKTSKSAVHKRAPVHKLTNDSAHDWQAIAYCLAFICFFCANPNNCFAAPAIDDKASVPAPQKTGDEEPRLRSMSVGIAGSMCTSCLKKLQEKLSSTDGISQVEVNLTKIDESPPSLKDEIHPRHRKALVQMVFDMNKISAKEILESIKQNDFAVSSISIGPKKQLSK